MTNPSTVAFIDVAHIFRSAWHASSDENLNSAFDYTTRAVSRIVGSPKFDRVVACFDGPPYKRTAFYPDYKANREKPDVLMVQQYKRVMERLRKAEVPIWRVKGFEADDLIATGTKQAVKAGLRVEIFSADKDLAQLVSEQVTVVSTRTGERWDPDFVEDKYGVRPEHMLVLLAIDGDKSDNIPGCPGLGPKAVVKLLEQHDTLEAILSAEIPGRVGRLLQENKDDILLSAAMVELMDDAPGWETCVFGDGAMVDENEEREAIQAEADQAEERMVLDVPDGTAEMGGAVVAEHEQPSGDRLIGGALTVQQAVAPPPVSEPMPRAELERRAEGNPFLTPAPTVETHPGLAKAAPAAVQSTAPTVAAIELRPGLSVSEPQIRLMLKMANQFHLSGLYRRFESVEAIFTVMELGLEYGMGPQVSLQNFHMIEGKPCMGAHMLIARAEQHPECVYMEIIEETDEKVVYETKRRSSGRVLTFEYTIEMAQQAGLLRPPRQGKKPGPWLTQRRAMMRKTAGSQAARAWYPGANTGLYSLEEMGTTEEFLSAQAA